MEPEDPFPGRRRTAVRGDPAEQKTAMLAVIKAVKGPAGPYIRMNNLDDDELFVMQRIRQSASREEKVAISALTIQSLFRGWKG